MKKKGLNNNKLRIMLFLAAHLRREREEFARFGRCEPVAAPATRGALTSPRNAVQHRSDDLKMSYIATVFPPSLSLSFYSLFRLHSPAGGGGGGLWWAGVGTNHTTVKSLIFLQLANTQGEEKASERSGTTYIFVICLLTWGKRWYLEPNTIGKPEQSSLLIHTAKRSLKSRSYIFHYSQARSN
jgi:hypothetical protein